MRNHAQENPYKFPSAFYCFDSLDFSRRGFRENGWCGAIRAILTGVFAASAVHPIFKDSNGNVLVSGLIEGNAHQLLNQLIVAAIAWTLGIMGALAILTLVDKLIGLGVSPEQETQGLDLSQPGKKGPTGRLRFS